MISSFSTRIAAYFGALFVAAMAVLFSVSYFGLPLLGLAGAGAQRLAQATHSLELSADHRRDFFLASLRDRRGDIQVMAENKVIAKQLEKGDRALQSDFERISDRLRRAYPDRYLNLLIVDPQSKRIRASTQVGEIGRAFNDGALVERAARPGIHELIEPMVDAHGSTLAIVHQVRAPDMDGYAGGTLVGILIAVLDSRLLLGEDLASDQSAGTTLLFDAAGQVVAGAGGGSGVSPANRAFQRNAQVANGFEGTLQDIESQGMQRVVVYRHLQLSGTQGWTLVRYVGTQEALAALKGSINRLALIGLLLTLVALGLISLLARRVTRPLHLLAGTARQLGGGDLSVRALARGRETREIASLCEAFNVMADSIQISHQTLEDRVLEQTAELSLSEENLDITLHSIGDAVIATDVDGLITRMNSTAERLTGWTLQDAAGRALPEVFRIVNAQTREPSINPVQRVIACGEIVGLANHTTLLARDGCEYQISDSAAPIRESGGEIVGLVLVFSDITERYRVDAALQESERQYRALVSAIPDIIFTNRRDGTYLDVQVSDPVLLFVPPQGFLQRTITEILPRDLADLFMQAFARALDLQVMQEVTYSLPVAGQDKFFEARVVAASADTVISIVRDITTRKQAEDALRIAAIAFEAQEGITVTNAEQVILQVNRAFTEITGYSAQEAIGQNPRLMASGRHDAAFYSAMWAALALDGAWKGEIWNRRKSGEVFPQWLTITAVKSAAAQTTHYVGTFTDISERKNAEDQIQTLAFYDPLTGLPNRRLLMDRLTQALATGLRHQRKGALLFVDLDNFKVINDTLGHYQGDLLLEQVAKRLGACVREGDTVARLGGDEFVVMLENLSENLLEAANQAETVGEKILAALNQVYQLGSYEHHSTPSIGVTLFGGEQPESIDEPLKRADLAMYQAKAAGRNTLRFFDPQMQAVVSARAELEAGLREAVENGQFVLHFQCQVDGQAQTTGVEALVRWCHPRLGIVAPAEFIALAEENGLILPLGLWVLRSACSQLAAWAARPAMAHLTMAVNVSARQFHQDDFVAQVLAVLERTGANPQRLKLELTESLLVDNLEDVITKMSALKARGVGFSLDDFGTGFSSLSYLKRLPLDQLKIDQSFVRDLLTDPNDAAIARTIVALGHGLELKVIAEGVETAAQRDALASMGCDAYQGYYFGRPVPVEEMAEI